MGTDPVVLQVTDDQPEPRQRQRTARRRARKRAMRRRQAAALFVVVGLIVAFAIFRTSSQARTKTAGVTGQSAVLPTPLALQPFQRSSSGNEGQWRAVGRIVNGYAAVYETDLRFPDNPSVRAGIAWMDTKLLKARLYSGSLSPGGLFWKFTAPVSAFESRTLVAAFNGGFLLKDSNGGYLSEGHLIAPLRTGAASLVIYKNGTATVGAWGQDVSMTSGVVAVRQNLTLLVNHGRPVSGLNPTDTSTWGYSLNHISNAWRSGLGVTSDGALVYAAGPMNIVDLANILIRAGAIRAMVLDMNPLWPVFATYAPKSPNGIASPANGTDLLSTMVQSPARFFETAYDRDFITMSAP